MFGKKLGPLDNFKEVFRKKHAPIYVAPGDKIAYTYKEPGQPDIVLAVDTIEKHMTLTEIVAFRCDFEGRQALGGLLLESEKDTKMK